MDGRQERVLVSTHALVVTDGVRFRTISGALRRRPVRRARIIEPLSSFPSNNLEELPSPQLITFLRVHDHPVRIAPVSQHRPTQRPVHTAPIPYAAAVTTANHLPPSTRPPRSHSARVAAPALAHRLCRSISLRNAPCTPPFLFTQLPSQQLATQRDNYSKGNNYRDETEGAEK